MSYKITKGKQRRLLSLQSVPFHPAAHPLVHEPEVTSQGISSKQLPQANVQFGPNEPSSQPAWKPAPAYFMKCYICISN